MTRSPLSDLRHLRHATPEQAAAWRRLRDLVTAGLLGGPCDGLRLHWLVYWRWFWRDRKDR